MAISKNFLEVSNFLIDLFKKIYNYEFFYFNRNIGKLSQKYPLLLFLSLCVMTIINERNNQIIDCQTSIGFLRQKRSSALHSNSVKTLKVDLSEDSVENTLKNGENLQANLNFFCYNYGTYIISNMSEDEKQTFPGITSFKSHHNITFQKYYKNVIYILSILAFFTFISIFSLSNLIKNKISNVFDKKNCTQFNIDKFILCLNKSHSFVLIFYFETVFKILIIFSKILILMVFVNYNFYKYGYQIFKELFLYKTIFYFNVIFPKITKCTYHYFTNTNDLATFSVQCLLPLNLFNRYIFLIVYLTILFQIIIISFEFLNKIIMFFRFKNYLMSNLKNLSFNQFLFLKCILNNSKEKHLILTKMSQINQKVFV